MIHLVLITITATITAIVTSLIVALILVVLAGRALRRERADREDEAER